MNSKKVLIVEDDEAFVPLIKLALREMNVVIDVAKNGAQALFQVKNQNYDLIISDYRLPEIHGIEILKAAKQKNSNCKMVLISAADTDMMEPDIIDLNLLGFLQKPLSPIELRKLISTAF